MTNNLAKEITDMALKASKRWDEGECLQIDFLVTKRRAGRT
ncbi:hypothetical protein ACW180_07505 [Limosilactobacillus fermentum]